jgi:hypothetical protein
MSPEPSDRVAHLVALLDRIDDIRALPKFTVDGGWQPTEDERELLLGSTVDELNAAINVHLADLEVRMDADKRGFEALNTFEERFGDRLREHGTIGELLPTLNPDERTEAERLLRAHLDASFTAGTAHTADDMREQWYEGKVRAVERDKYGEVHSWQDMILDPDVAANRSELIEQLREVEQQLNALVRGVIVGDPDLDEDAVAAQLVADDSFRGLTIEQAVLFQAIDRLDDRHGVDG